MRSVARSSRVCAWLLRCPRCARDVAQPPPPPPAAPMPADPSELQAGDAERLKNPDGRRLADGPAHLRRLGLQPARSDHAGERQRGCSRSGSFSTGVTNGHEAPPIVNNGVMFVSTPGNQVIAIDAKTGALLWRYRRPLPDGRDPAAPDQPRRRALRRQGVLRGRRSGARRARREDRAGSVDDQGRRQQERLLHVAGAARRRRQGDGRRVGRRARHPRLRRGVRRRDRQGAVADLHGAGARRARQRDVAEGRSVEDRRRARSGSPATTIRRPTSRSGAPATAARGWAISVPATTSTPRRRSRSTSRPARSRATSSTTRTIRGTGTRCRRRSSSTTSATAGRSRA